METKIVLTLTEACIRLACDELAEPHWIPVTPLLLSLQRFFTVWSFDVTNVDCAADVMFLIHVVADVRFVRRHNVAISINAKVYCLTIWLAIKSVSLSKCLFGEYLNLSRWSNEITSAWAVTRQTYVFATLTHQIESLSLISITIRNRYLLY